MPWISKWAAHIYAALVLHSIVVLKCWNHSILWGYSSCWNLLRVREHWFPYLPCVELFPINSLDLYQLLCWHRTKETLVRLHSLEEVIEFANNYSCHPPGYTLPSLCCVLLLPTLPCPVKPFHPLVRTQQAAFLTGILPMQRPSTNWCRVLCHCWFLLVTVLQLGVIGLGS